MELEIRVVDEGGQEDLAALNQWLASQRELPAEYTYGRARPTTRTSAAAPSSF